MSVLIVATDGDQVESLLTSAMAVVNAKAQQVTVLCWTHSPTVKHPHLADVNRSTENDALVQLTREVLDAAAQNEDAEFDPTSVRFHRVIGPDVTRATLEAIRNGQHDLVVVDASHSSTSESPGHLGHPLLRSSPCETILFYRTHVLPTQSKRILVVATDSPHDQVAFETFSLEGRAAPVRLTFARMEDEVGAEASELGRRELKRLMRAAGVKASKSIKRRVFSRDAWPAFLQNAEAHDLVLIGANQRDLIRELQQGTTKPAIAVIKRAPPFKRFGRIASNRWKTKLSPADYADMMQGLRRGANLNTDFLVMLGLAAAIASLGLLQDSPAVVIGSMLLAPLMTPMIACGLAIAQGSKKLGRRSMLAIGIGFLLTLAISFLVAIIAPGEEITSQIVARGNPNILDLMIALLSAVAAAYALARPGIVGAIAGVAIATALVPPLCSTGISLAYREYLNAHGAALLFATNLVAIILGAAVTFRLLGVTVAGADATERRWVYRITTAICIALMVLGYPLHRRLNRRIDQGQTQPRTYPLTKVTHDALVGFIERTPDIELVSSGRPSTLHDQVDVVLVLSSPEPLSASYKEKLVEICQQQMDDARLVVQVHCFLDAWQANERPASDGQNSDSVAIKQPDQDRSAYD